MSIHGIYLGTGEGITPISYADIQEAQLTATDEIIITTVGTPGSVRLKIRAQRVELVFVLWPVCYMPGHSRLIGRTWIPGDWFVHAVARDYDIDTTPWPQIRPALP